MTSYGWEQVHLTHNDLTDNEDEGCKTGRAAATMCVSAAMAAAAASPGA